MGLNELPARCVQDSLRRHNRPVKNRYHLNASLSHLLITCIHALENVQAPQRPAAIMPWFTCNQPSRYVTFEVRHISDNAEIIELNL